MQDKANDNTVLRLAIRNFLHFAMNGGVTSFVCNSHGWSLKWNRVVEVFVLCQGNAARWLNRAAGNWINATWLTVLRLRRADANGFNGLALEVHHRRKQNQFLI